MKLNTVAICVSISGIIQPVAATTTTTTTPDTTTTTSTISTTTTTSTVATTATTTTTTSDLTTVSTTELPTSLDGVGDYLTINSALLAALAIATMAVLN